MHQSYTKGNTLSRLNFSKLLLLFFHQFVLRCFRFFSFAMKAIYLTHIEIQIFICAFLLMYFVVVVILSLLRTHVPWLHPALGGIPFSCQVVSALHSYCVFSYFLHHRAFAVACISSLTQRWHIKEHQQQSNAILAL